MVSVLQYTVMRTRPFPLGFHIVLLLAFVAAMVGVWLLPVLLAGAPYDIPPLLAVRNYVATGLFTITDALGRFLAPPAIGTLGVPVAMGNRLSVFLFSVLGSGLPFTDLVGWTALTAVVMAAALIPWWFAVYRLFGTRVAWVATVLLALMPIYWREALWLNHYQFAFLFLFASFAAFVWLRERHHLLALAVAGALFGLAAGAKDAFLVFTLWFVLEYVWLFRRNLTKAARGILVFGVCAGFLYLLPYIGDIQRYGYPVNQNLAILWPGAKEVQEDFYLHLYPDPYTYFFDRDRFDAELLARVPTMSTLERLQMQKILINFDVGAPGFFTQIGNGFWLFLGSLSSYFLQDTLGGIVLWLFILAGIVVLRRRNAFLAGALVGLLLVSEFIIRFVLHFSREHFMDVGWVLALLAAIGIVDIADTLAPALKRLSGTALTVLITVVLALQLLQANRVKLAREYSRTIVADTVAAAEEIAKVIPEAIVAMPLPPMRLEQIGQMSGRSVVLFDPTTIERLLQEKKLPEAFEKYGVTHIARFESDLSTQMKRAVPSLTVIPDRDVPPSAPTVTPFLRFILHHIR
ncbi:MAG: hypothetical protein Q7R81_01510 [Candidatus Peregrinibacteria bacterium]|nr:hypothetical protein [Candidatus Peregrinibacteria bacterium]